MNKYTRQQINEEIKKILEQERKEEENVYMILTFIGIFVFFILVVLLK